MLILVGFQYMTATLINACLSNQYSITTNLTPIHTRAAIIGLVLLETPMYQRHLFSAMRWQYLACRIIGTRILSSLLAPHMLVCQPNLTSPPVAFLLMSRIDGHSELCNSDKDVHPGCWLFFLNAHAQTRSIHALTSEYSQIWQWLFDLLQGLAED